MENSWHERPHVLLRQLHLELVVVGEVLADAPHQHRALEHLGVRDVELET
jgi:hypothetical protein